MSKYILICPICESSDLKKRGHVFICQDCEEETFLEDMDYEKEE